MAETARPPNAGLSGVAPGPASPASAVPSRSGLPSPSQPGPASPSRSSPPNTAKPVAPTQRQAPTRRLRPVPEEPVAVTACTNVALHTSDPLVSAGLAAMLAPRTDITMVSLADDEGADVIMVDDRVDDLPQALHALRERRPVAKLVVLGGDDWKADLFAAAEAGLAAVIPRSEISVKRIIHCIETVAQGGGDLPLALQGTMLDQMRHVQSKVLRPRGLTAHGLDHREVDVLRLLANGLGIREIGVELCYSERTVKNILHILMTRLRLNNRAHAVAYAIRAGVI